MGAVVDKARSEMSRGTLAVQGAHQRVADVDTCSAPPLTQTKSH